MSYHNEVSSYNGWANRPTWHLKLIIDNTEHLQGRWHRLARKLSAVDLEAELRRWVNDYIHQVKHVMDRELSAGDIVYQLQVMLDWSESFINYREIAESLIEDVSEVAA